MIVSILADLTREICYSKTGTEAKIFLLDKLEIFIVVNFAAKN